MLHSITDKLKEILKKDKIRFLDSSCGDMFWMPEFLNSRSDVVFTGYDLDEGNIESNKKKFSDKPWTFKVITQYFKFSKVFQTFKPSSGWLIEGIYVLDNSTFCFQQHDAFSDKINDSFDLILSRHTMIHLYNADTMRVIKNFKDSGSK